MNYIALTNSYLCLNFLIIIGYFVFNAFKFKSSSRLQVQYFSLFLTFIFVGLQPFFPESDFTNSTVKVWSAESMNGIQFSNDYVPKAKIVSFGQDENAQIPEETRSILILILGLVGIIGCWKLVKEVLLLRSIRKSSYIFRRIGKIYLLINDKIQMPFSFWLPGKYYTVLPSTFLSSSNDFKVSLYHELQHHRQGDTKVIYPLMFLRAICFLNPFVHLLAEQISEIQELACDEQILEAKKVSSQDYISCLIRVAQTAVSKGSDPVCAAGFCFNKGRHILKRRIQMMNVVQRPPGLWAKSCAVILMTMIVTVTVYASRNFVQDRRISLDEAKEMATKAATGTEFPIVVNSEVLTQLNRFLGTPEGREFIKTALERKKEYDQILSEVTSKYHNPYELNAIPIAESGYQNLPSRYSVRAAGPWMFIPSTARKYGLRVEDGLDERLDVSKETDAAHRYLLSNKLLFNDWLLAIYAYNVGESAVIRGIKKYGTRDVWELSKYVKGDKDYMAKIMAAVIIMKNPEVLEQ